MAIIKCKMCGGDMEIAADKTFGTCEYCGSTMTLPKVDDEQRAAAFNRGNHFRRIGEFDKALGVYERIVQENDADAEAHWCCALCRFGIEYVEDPTTYEWLPTCHRLSFDSFLEDVDYLAALEHSDGITRRQYQKDAAKIAEVQRGILATSQNAQPFDVFICYKESDENGERTRDSALAQDIYYQLTEQGRRVFFARITLEDVTGAEYEPYIFAALNSAKVMVVVGTRAEYLNAVWVKNEWSRFLALMKKDRSKLLLPCYRDMDPYDLPEQLSILQSYDMSKIGFLQDLTRGIAKVLDANKAPAPAAQTVVMQSGGGNADALLKRGQMALEDREWDKADGFFEEVLNLNAECAEAYIGKALAASRKKTLKDLAESWASEVNGGKSTNHALEENRDRARAACEKYILPGYLESERIEKLYTYDLSYTTRTESLQESKQAVLRRWAENKHLTKAAKFAAGQAKTELDAAYAALTGKMDRSIAKAKAEAEQTMANLRTNYAKFLDSADAKAARLHEGACAKREADYQSWIELVDQSETFAELKSLSDRFGNLGDYKDSRVMAEKAAEKAEQVGAADAARRARENAARKKKFTFIGIVAGAVAVLVIAVIIIVSSIQKANRYEAAEELLASGDSASAAIAFAELGNYRDSGNRSAQLWSEVAQRETIAAGGYHTVGLKSNGTVAAVGDNDDGQRDVSGWRDIVAVSAGQYHTVGLESDGTVVAVGDDGQGRCDISDWVDIAAVSAGSSHTVGLKMDGTVVAVGLNAHGQCDVDDWTDIVAVSAKSTHTVGLKSDGTVVVAGNDSSGKCNVDDWADIVAVSAGYNHTVGLKSDGTVVAVGDNRQDQCDVSDWTDIVAISAGGKHTVGLKSDGTVVAVGYNGEGQCDVDDWTDIVAVSAGYEHTVGLKSDGTVVAVGENDDGQCDVGNWTYIKTPD